ncbi:WD repeat-containing protein 64 [Tritrichomonas musculus]|uniref:WD repeat-containing protein 64 n=1 Tax=Tritrichomonas musculus TaxID=1915356 RepID=A0ABR2L6B2_9EUKA
MNTDISLKLGEQISEMRRQEIAWELEKTTIQSKISSLQQEESRWLDLKDALLSRLRILRSAAAAPPSSRQEILSKLPQEPFIQLLKSANAEKENDQTNKTNSNDNSKETNNDQKDITPLVSFGRVRKSPGKDSKKRRTSIHRSANDSASKFDSSSAEPSDNYILKCTLSQHLDCVRCVVFHPTLPYVATGSDDGCIRITNLDPPRKPRIRHHPVQLMCLRGHSGAVLSLAAYHNELISCDVNGQVCVWDFSETKPSMNEFHGRIDHHLKYLNDEHTDAIWSIAANERSPYFVTASSDKTIRIHDFQTQKSEAIPIPEGPTVVSFNSDGSFFIVGCLNGCIHIFEDKQDKGTVDLQSCVISICHSAKRDEMFIACEDKSLKVVDIANRKVLKQIIPHELYTSSMAITSDGHFLTTTSPDKTIRIWGLPNLNVIAADSHHQPKYGEAGLCIAATLSSNSHDYFASGGADGIVKVFARSK